MQLDGDRTQAHEIADYAQSIAESTRDDRHKMVGPSMLYYAALARMDRYRPSALTHPQDAMRYADGLMLAIAASKPLRRRNLLGMAIDRSLVRQPNGDFKLSYAKSETTAGFVDRLHRRVAAPYSTGIARNTKRRHDVAVTELAWSNLVMGCRPVELPNRRCHHDSSSPK